MSALRSISRVVAGLLSLAGLACSGDSTAPPPAPPPPPPPPQAQPATMARVSGHDQEGKVGETLGEPFVVRVTDARGDGVEGFEVRWSVESGEGGLGSSPPVFQSLLPRSFSSLTDADGLAEAFFEPHVLGTSTVTADVVPWLQLEGSPVTFTADATVQLIFISHSGWFCVPPGDCFPLQLDCSWMPCWGVPAAVPVGTAVEWVSTNWGGDDAPHTVTSVSAPPGGAAFDSGPLAPGDRFQFVPEVAGTWEYVNEVSGFTGSLTVE